MENFLARVCNSCPFCNYARSHPENWIGKAMLWHGSWCPAWKAWENVYGEGESKVSQMTVKETEQIAAAFLTMKGSYSQMNDSFGRLYGWMEEKGYAPSGPPLGIYFNNPHQVYEDELAWELISPINGEVEPSDPDEEGVGIKWLEPVMVASTTHKGSWEEITKTYEWLTAAINDQGYQIAGPAQEVYLTNPTETPPKKLLTEIRFPVNGPA